MSVATEIAKILLNIECVQVSPSDPFTYASGLKGPIYCDNRKILSHVGERNKVVQSFIDLIKEKNFQFDQLAGLATAGIPHAAFIAGELGLPMIYIRDKAKGHGKGNQVEGHYQKGQKILLIEDLVNQGSSLEKAVDGATNAGLEVIGCLSIVDYEMPKSREILKKLKLDLFSLTNFSTLADTACALGKIGKDEIEMLKAWHRDPAKWHESL